MSRPNFSRAVVHKVTFSYCQLPQCSNHRINSYFTPFHTRPVNAAILFHVSLVFCVDSLQPNMVPWNFHLDVILKCGGFWQKGFYTCRKCCEGVSWKANCDHENQKNWIRQKVTVRCVVSVGAVLHHTEGQGRTWIRSYNKRNRIVSVFPSCTEQTNSSIWKYQPRASFTKQWDLSPIFMSPNLKRLCQKSHRRAGIDVVILRKTWHVLLWRYDWVILNVNHPKAASDRNKLWKEWGTQ